LEEINGRRSIHHSQLPPQRIQALSEQWGGWRDGVHDEVWISNAE
jgi:ribosome modulation factor